ncbi:hypothetical protein BASA81_002931 [Batrachochytrium salamandrivorans]|nr:hypothetical protein BASA81_002931 [Batrachochytrium salamandrivorans]
MTNYNANRDDTDIAVVGISSILASGENLYENWESIRSCLDHVSDLPADRVDVTAYYNPDKTTKDHVYCKRGYFIPDYDIDPRDYGLNFNQVEDSDANQLLTLLKVKEALSDSGLQPNSKERRNVGVVLGIGGGQKASHEFYSRLNYVVMEKVLQKMGMPEDDVKTAVEKYKSQFPEWRVDSFPGFLGNVTAGRCCNVFNLDGMNCVVDAACASSLIALKVAIDELLHGDCETMVCGATCTDNSLGMYMAFSKTPVFSTDPGVKAYDESTKGMLIGEGSVMMVLKKLSKAIADGDQVHAVIRGVASSSDGKAPGIYVPTISGQELCIERAWAKVNEELKTCTLMEGHGTGTPVGDKIELTGMRNQFENKGGCAKEQVAVGSIKSQIGHTKAVAGFAGLVKVIMALKHKVLPFTLNVKNPPTLMDGTKLSDTCLYANLRNRPWFVPREIGIRRAGISSFGFGGANYHMVVEEFEAEHTKPYRMHDMPLPVVFHAASVRELVANLKAVVASLEQNALSEDPILRDVAYDALQVIRKANQVGAFEVMPANHPRVGILATDKPRDFTQDLKKMIEALEREPTKDEIKLRSDFVYKSKGLDCRGKVAALFAGQGSQYLNMYEDVAMNWPEFRQAVVDMDKASSQICGARASAFMFPRTPYQTETELLKQQEAEISTVRNAQLAITSVSVGGFAIFQRAGFKPDFVAGHSLGEYAALHASGALDRSEVCELVCNRATAMQSAFKPGEDMGRMIAVVGDNVENKVRPEATDVWVANMNSPSQVVLTGSAKGIEQDAARLAGLGFRVHPLNTGGAFHSPKMAPAERVFYERLAASKILPLKHDAPRAYGNVSGELYPAGDAEAVRKGLAKQMTSSVQFTSQIRAMYKDGARVFVEFGPKNILAKLVTQILGENSGAIAISLNPSSTKSADLQMREAALQCALAGVQFQSAFDPWGTRNPFKGVGGYFNDIEADKKARSSKTRVKMTAATYVSKKTLEERQRVLGDGKLLSCFTSQTPRSAAANPGGFDSNKEELARLRSQLEDAKRDAAAKALEAEKLREALAKQQAQSHDNVSSGQKLHIEQMLLNYEDLTKQIKGALGGAPVAAAAPVYAAPAAPIAAASSGADRAHVEKVLRKVLSESTGFDESMLTNDLNLEEDLGIDSIKRVEFVSNVSSQFGVTVGTEAMDKLARTRLVGEVVEVFVNDVFGGASTAPVGAAAPKPVAAPTSSAVKGGMNRDGVIAVLRKVLSDSTGFDEQLLTMDLNLEEDLGVDSIKRVEFVSNVSSLLNITVSSEAMDQLARTRLVGEVCDVFCSVVIPSGSSAAVAAAAPMAVAAPAASNGGMSRDAITKVLQKVLSESTGFDEAMLTSDLNLEEDLGIDSIKRVEFVSNVSGQFGVTVGAEAMDKLARTRLVGEVVDVFVNDVFGGAAAAPKAAAPVAVAAPKAAASNGGMSRDAITKVLQKVLSESTGFDESMLTNDLNLEEDLGIDSIKRVEFVSNVSGQFGVTVGAEAMDKLARTRLVGEVVEVFVNDVFGGSSTAVAAPKPVAAAPVAAAAAPASSNGGLSRDAITKVLQKVLSDSTGFDEAMLTNDLNLEEDLGIDSIKRVEFVSNVSSQFGVTVGAEAMDKLARTRLVGEVVDVFVNDVFGGASSAAPKAAAPVAVAAAAPKTAPSNGGLSRDAITKVLQKVLSDSTGFDEAMLTNDLNLEEDLGIDSIKRVEFVSNVSSQFGVTVSSEAMDKLARTRLVGEVVDVFVNDVFGGSSAAPAAVAPVAVAPKAAPASSNGGLSRDAITKVLQKVLSDSTGFDEAMLTNDLNLEEDLGIDSIKRVEFVSNVSSQFGVTVGAEAMDKLARTRLVGEVVDVFVNDVFGGASSAAPAAAVAAAPKPAAAAAPAPSNGGLSRDAITKVLQKVLSDSTGFDEAMLTNDLNLEEDLGIDSIKRVEFVSNVSSQFGVTVSSEAMDKLARTRLVGEVVDVFVNDVFGGAAAAPAPVAPTAAVAAAAPAAVSGFDRARVTKILQKVLSESTGFDESMLTDDLNLEEDLGVDSIKRVELISNVSAQFNVPVGPEAMDKLGRTRLVGEVIDVFCANVGASSAVAVSTTPATGDKSKPLRAPDCGHLTLTSASAVEIALPDRQKLQRSSDRPIVVVDDGTPLAANLVAKLGGVLLVFGPNGGGKNVVNLADASEAALQEGLAQVVKRFGAPGGFIYLPASGANAIRGDIAKQNCWAMLAAKHVKPFLADQPVAKGRTSFVAVARLDGKLGLAGGNAKADEDLVAVAEKGAVFGLCKTLDLEWPHAFCRGVDLDQSISADQAVDILLRELDCANLNLREVGYTKDGKRFTTQAINLLPGSVPATPIDKSDVFVVTGGARGITPLCVTALAKQIGGGTYLLLGRSKLVPEPAWATGKQVGKELDTAATQFAKDQFAAGKGEKPTPKVVRALSNGVEATREILESLASINGTGAKAEYIGVDVSNAELVAKALQGRKVTGIFHASGVLRDKMIQNKTPEDFEAVYGTKVYGLRALFKVIPPSTLRHLIVFSSLAGFHGNRGQSDYSLANEVLNKSVFVVQSKFPQCSARALDFGPWGGGMVTPALQKMFEDQGVEIIPRLGGAETVANVLLNTASAQCLFGNWGLPPVRPLEPVVRVTRELSTAANGVNAFLHSHVVKGKRVLPFTIMTASMGQLAVNTHPGYALHAVTDIQLFRGIVCEPGVDMVQMDFAIQDLKAEEGGRLEVEVKASFTVNGKDVPSYRCVAVLGERARPAFSAPALSSAETSGKVLDKNQAYNMKMLFHGKDFQSIQTVTACSEDRVVAELAPVQVSNEGQFPIQGIVDGYLTDTAYQLALVHARLLHNSGALPNFAKTIDYYTTVPAGTTAYGVLLKEKDNEQQKGDAKIVKWQFYMCSAQGTVFQAGRISVVLNPSLTWE